VKEYKLTPQPLTKEAFAAFGDVVEVPVAKQSAQDGSADSSLIIINGGNTERYDSLAKVELEAAGSSDKKESETHAVINIFRAQPRPVSKDLAMDIEMVERHPFGSQSFHPLSGEPYLVLVADAVEEPTPENLHLFIAGADQGINYHKNTWHHPVLGLNKVCDFLVVDRKGGGNNCEEFFFGNEVKIQITC
jgi:ureidoglycolate lyase